MEKKILVVIDMQNDFVDGALGSSEAQAVLPLVEAKVESFDGEVIYTRDTHGDDYPDTQEGKLLPVAHCIKGSGGWQLAGRLGVFAEKNNSLIYEKNTFGSYLLADALAERYRAGELESVELVGLCTDICVISNALLIKAKLPELPLYVDGSCCAGVTPEKHRAALQVMESCQCIII